MSRKCSSAEAIALAAREGMIVHESAGMLSATDCCSEE